MQRRFLISSVWNSPFPLGYCTSTCTCTGRRCGGHCRLRRATLFPACTIVCTTSKSPSISRCRIIKAFDIEEEPVLAMRNTVSLPRGQSKIRNKSPKQSQENPEQPYSSWLQCGCFILGTLGLFWCEWISFLAAISDRFESRRGFERVSFDSWNNQSRRQTLFQRPDRPTTPYTLSNILVASLTEWQQWKFWASFRCLEFCRISPKQNASPSYSQKIVFNHRSFPSTGSTTIHHLLL